MDVDVAKREGAGTGADDGDGRSGTKRLESLKEDVAGLRIRGGSARTEQRVKLGGAVLIPLGLVFIILGWYGASDTIFVDEQIAYLHAHRRGDPAVDALADTLAAAAGGEEFTTRWRQRPLTSGRTGIHDVTHPEVGPLRLNFEGLELADRNDQRMIVYLPADAASSAGLDRLVRRHPAGLRSITSQASTR